MSAGAVVQLVGLAWLVATVVARWPYVSLPALGVAALGTLYLSIEPDSVPRAFASVKLVQLGIVALLAVGAAALPRFTTAPAGAVRRTPAGRPA